MTSSFGFNPASIIALFTVLNFWYLIRNFRYQRQAKQEEQRYKKRHLHSSANIDNVKRDLSKSTCSFNLSNPDTRDLTIQSIYWTYSGNNLYWEVEGTCDDGIELNSKLDLKLAPSDFISFSFNPLTIIDQPKTDSFSDFLDYCNRLGALRLKVILSTGEVQLLPLAHRIPFSLMGQEAQSSIEKIIGSIKLYMLLPRVRYERPPN